MCRLIFIALSILTVTTSSFAKSPVWKVSKGDDYLYLGGTIHLLSKNDYPLPAAFDKAYADADDVWFETDNTALSSPAVQTQLLGVMMFQDQRSLSTELDRGTYNELAKFMADRELPMAAFDKFTPAGLMFTLTAIELQRLGLIDETAGVDLHFEQRAQQDDKDRLQLETVEEQIGFMNSMNDIEANYLIKSTMAEISKTSEVWGKLLSAWRTGDMALMNKVGIVEMKRDFPTIYQTLLLNRNMAWVSDIKKMLESKDIELVLVGALHMAGEDGLLNSLKAAGYRVEQMD